MRLQNQRGGGRLIGDIYCGGERMNNLDKSDVLSALNQKGAQKCESCGFNQWTLATPGPDASDADIAQLPLQTQPGKGLSLAVLVCSNCGNTRLYHADTLMRGVKHEQ